MLLCSRIRSAEGRPAARTALGVAALLSLGAAAFLSLTLAGAAQARPYDDTPCAQDAKGLCGSERPALRPLRECLEKGQKQKKLEAACSAYLEEQSASRRAAVEQKKADFWKICAKEIDEHCADFRKTAFQARSCLDKRRDELSKQCNENVPQIGAYRGAGWAGIKDESETPEMRIERAERLRPGSGGEQMRKRIELEKMPEAERKALLAKQRAEAAAKRESEGKARMEEMNKRSAPVKPKPKLSEEERAKLRAERQAKAAERQAEWKKRREEWAKKRAEETDAAKPGTGTAADAAAPKGGAGAAADGAAQ